MDLIWLLVFGAAMATMAVAIWLARTQAIGAAAVQIAELRERVGGRERELNNLIDRARMLDAEVQTLRTGLAAESEARAAAVERATQVPDLTRQVDELAADRSQLASMCEDLRVERARLERTVEQERSAGAEKLNFLEGAREKLERTLGERVNTLEGEVASLRGQLSTETENRISAVARADQVPILVERIASLETERTELASTCGSLRVEHARLERALEEERRAATEKLALLDDATRKLENTFKALAADALRTNNSSFLQLAGARLDASGVKWSHGSSGNSSCSAPSFPVSTATSRWKTWNARFLAAVSGQRSTSGRGAERAGERDNQSWSNLARSSCHSSKQIASYQRVASS
jgi:predicted  nucleic acid-binding Zn-ribbon protein